MVEGVVSFHLVRDACLADQTDGWRHCVRLYAPLARQLLQHYFPALEQPALLVQVFDQARAQQARLWRTFAGSSEKEFLLHWRGFVLEQGRAARGAPPPTPLTPENFWAVLEEFPPLQREMLLLSFRRYSPEQVNAITKFGAETARAVVEQGRERLQARLGEAVDADVHTRDHDALFTALEKQRGEKCLSDKLYPRILDGQITWREREEAERHIENCPYCLNRFAEFREVSYFYRTLPPAEHAAAADVQAALGWPGEEPARKKKSRWLRWLGG